MIAHDLDLPHICMECVDGLHHPGVARDWADALDVEFAKATHQLNPAGQQCACPCARGTND